MCRATRYSKFEGGRESSGVTRLLEDVLMENCLGDVDIATYFSTRVSQGYQRAYIQGIHSP